MRRSFGSSRGMGGGGMLRQVGRVVGAGVGGVQESLSTARPKTTGVLSLSSSSSSPPSVSLPVSATSTATTWRSSPYFVDEDDWENVDEEEEDNGFASVFGPVPSRGEVEGAFAAIQQVLVPAVYSQIGLDGSPHSPNVYAADLMINSTDLASQLSSPESESDWMEPALHLFNPNALQPQRSNNVLDAFRLMQMNPSIQRMVVSLSSDKAVWNAVMNNEVVQELRESFYAAHSAENNQSPSSDDNPRVAMKFLTWILDNTKAKIIEFIKKITKLVNDLFREPAPDKEGTKDIFEDTMRSSLMLSILVLLVVVVTRVDRTLTT